MLLSGFIVFFNFNNFLQLGEFEIWKNENLWFLGKICTIFEIKK